MTTDIKDKFRNIAQNLPPCCDALNSGIHCQPGGNCHYIIGLLLSRRHISGNELRQHDMQQGAAIGQEAKAYTGVQRSRAAPVQIPLEHAPIPDFPPTHPTTFSRWINIWVYAGRTLPFLTCFS